MTILFSSDKLEYLSLKLCLNLHMKIVGPVLKIQNVTGSLILKARKAVHIKLNLPAHSFFFVFFSHMLYSIAMFLWTQIFRRKNCSKKKKPVCVINRNHKEDFLVPYEKSPTS